MNLSVCWALTNRLRRQRGAALIVALLLLVVGLMLALSSMQTSRMEESMAGNHRASERALMAAEVGASKIASAFHGKALEDMNLTEVLDVLLDDGFVLLDSNEKNADGLDAYTQTNAYYRVSIGTPEGTGSSLPLMSTGIVTSGGAKGEVVASREVVFDLGVVGFAKLSAINAACPVSFSLASNATGVEGELVDENVDGLLRYNPAVSVGSRQEARFMVYSVLKPKHTKAVNEVTEADISGSATFTSRAGSVYEEGLVESEDGVYHASDVIEPDGTVNYLRQCGANNRMCNYQGGIATGLEAAIVGRPSELHDFIKLLMRDVGNRTVDGLSDVVNFERITGNDDPFLRFENDKINIYTDTTFHMLGQQNPLSIEDGLAGVPLLFSANSIDYEQDVDENDAPIGPLYIPLKGGEFQGAYTDATEAALASADVLLAKYPGNASLTDASIDYGDWQSNAFYLPTTQPWVDEPILPDVDLAYREGSSPGYFLQVDALTTGTDDVGDGSAVVRPSLEFKSPKEDKRGILIVDGNATFKGSPNFNGLIIVLGDFVVSGGGGDQLEGSIIAAPYYHDGSQQRFSCQSVRYDANGGGSLDAIYSKAALDRVWRLLSPEAQMAWTLGGGGGLTGELQAWREKVGN
ncbi:hypothetical protein LG312_07350 [Halomonas sp.]